MKEWVPWVDNEARSDEAKAMVEVIAELKNLNRLLTIIATDLQRIADDS